STSSITPTTAASTAATPRPRAWMAAFPSWTSSTRSPMPALTESMASTVGPFGAPEGSTGWMSRSFAPSSFAFFCVATTVPTTRARNTALLLHLDAVDHADDGRVHGRVLEAGGHARGRARHHQHAVAQARVDGVDGDHVAGLVAAGGIGGAHHQELGPHEL